MDLTCPDPVVAAIRMGWMHAEEVPSTCTESRSIVGLTFRSSLVLVTLHAMVVMPWWGKTLEVQSWRWVLCCVVLMGMAPDHILYYVVVLLCAWLYLVVVGSW